MTGIVAMSRRLSSERLPWRFQVAHPESAHVEQYGVHLGQGLPPARRST